MAEKDVSLTIRIRDPKVLEEALSMLQGVLDEIYATNPHRQPIQFHTKARWAEGIEHALRYFGKFLPQPKD